MSDKAPRLDGVRFAVLALGDTAYVNFCGVGKAIDARLEELGASRAADRVDLDLDYAKQAAEWTEGALAKLAPPETAPAAAPSCMSISAVQPVNSTMTSRSLPTSAPSKQKSRPW